MTSALVAELKRDLGAYDTGGLKVASVRKAYRAARETWWALPLPIFEDAVLAWAKGINGVGLEDKADTDQGPLVDFIESYLLQELEPHVVVEFRGSKFQVKGVSRFGKEALTALWRDGQTLAGNVRDALLQLLQAMPPVPEDEALALQCVKFGVEGR